MLGTTRRSPTLLAAADLLLGAVFLVTEHVLLETIES